jgi:hypothetical protein
MLLLHSVVCSAAHTLLTRCSHAAHTLLHRVTNTVKCYQICGIEVAIIVLCADPVWHTNLMLLHWIFTLPEGFLIDLYDVLYFELGCKPGIVGISAFHRLYWPS